MTGGEVVVDLFLEFGSLSIGDAIDSVAMGCDVVSEVDGMVCGA